MIPKVIHYCWFGEQRKPKLIRDCIKSWRNYLPEYEIIEWNENNIDLSHPFVREFYQKRKWAFVADFVRLKVLCENGGIYLDTDMMVVKSFDSLLENECFFGAENQDYINAAIIGCEKKNEFIQKCLLRYNTIDLEKVTDLRLITIPRIITDVFRNKIGFDLFFDKKLIQDCIVIYPPVYFYPFPFENKKDLRNYEKYIKEETFAMHMWSSSWIEYSEFYYFRNREYMKGLQKSLKYIIEEKKCNGAYLRKLASCIKESFLKK